MKEKREIRNKIRSLFNELRVAKMEYKGLNQIDMLSSTGNKLNEKIHLTRGKLLALHWVLGTVKFVEE